MKRGENNKYFLGLERSRQSSNVVNYIKRDDGVVIENQTDILKSIGEFYDKLYTSKNPCQRDIDTYLELVDIENRISEADKKELGCKPNPTEIEIVINAMKSNRAPGYDGLPIEYYKQFWYIIKDLYLDMVCECWEIQDMPVSMKTAIISLIHKGDDKDRLKNYRPISLMNTDYKILAFVFAFRLQKCISYLINHDQCAYIKGRYIGCNIRNLIDIFDYCENENIEGALLNID